MPESNLKIQEAARNGEPPAPARALLNALRQEMFSLANIAKGECKDRLAALRRANERSG